jgi:hypothetical protein
LKSIDFEYVWKKIPEVVTLDDTVKKCITGIVYMINNNFFKLMSNAVFKIYKPVVPTKICNENKDCLIFMKNILDKKH